MNKNYEKLKNSIKKYSDFLETVSEEEFQLSPKSGSWSYSEVYSHIFITNILSFKGIGICIEGKAEVVKKGTPLKAFPWLILGVLPPGKFKIPKSLADKVKKISKAEASELIQKTSNNLEFFKDKIDLANPFQKVKHPRFGPFNTRNWFRFILIHSNHHLKQLDRIKLELLNDK